MIPTKALPSRSLSSAKFLLSTYRFPSSPPTPPAQLPILFLSHYEKNLSVFPLHFPFFFHHSYFFLFTLSKSPDKTILLKVTVYPVLLQTRFSLIISYCLTNSNFTALFKSSNQKYFSQTYPSQFLLLHKNSYKTSFLKSYSFAIDNITLYL